MTAKPPGLNSGKNRPRIFHSKPHRPTLLLRSQTGLQATSVFVMWKYANPQLQRLVSYEPGKPVEDLARELGIAPDKIIKLASNENPLGPSPKARQAMIEAIDRAHFYPDGGGYYLRQAIAEQNGLTMGHVILGCGSNEIIEFVGHAYLQPGDDIVVAKHSFAVYRLMAQLFGANVIDVPDPGFVHDLEGMLAAVTPRTKAIFIANPNNPTGTMVSQEEIDRFMERVPPRITVIFDEAYYEFLDNPPDVLQYVRAGRNVVALRTFSKIQGLANLRIGYGLATPEIIEVLQKTRQPFNANGVAQAGALAGLLDAAHMEETRRVTREGRNFLQSEFLAMELEYVPSHANFVLVRVGDGKNIFEALLRRGIIVRAMGSYGLPEWIRVSVGTMPQNTAFVEALRELDREGALDRGVLVPAS